jgi:hypothetical protein
LEEDEEEDNGEYELRGGVSTLKTYKGSEDDEDNAKDEYVDS